MTRLTRLLRLAGYHPTRWLALALIVAAAGLLWVADQCDIDLEDL